MILENLGFSEMSLPVQNGTAEQNFEDLLMREHGETSPVEGTPKRAPPSETPPDEEALQRAPVPERHRSKEHYRECQYQSERQGTLAWESGGPTITWQSSRDDITGSVERAPGGMPIPEVLAIEGSVNESATSRASSKGR